MKKIICLILSTLFLLSKTVDYKPKSDKLNNLRNSTRAMVKLEIEEVGDNISSALYYVDNYFSNNINFSEIDLINNPNISGTTIFNLIKETILDIPQNAKNLMESKRSYLKEFDAFLALVNGNFILSNSVLNYSTYINPFFVNNMNLGYLDLDFRTPNNSPISTFDSINYLVNLGVDTRIATIFSGTFFAIIAFSIEMLAVLATVAAILIVIIILCFVYLAVLFVNCLNELFKMIVYSFSELITYSNGIWEKILSYLEYYCGVEMIQINNENYISQRFDLARAYEYLNENQSREFYIITNTISQNQYYWQIIPKSFSKEFIINNKVYDLGFNTFTQYASDAKDAVVQGTTNAIYYELHTYSNSTTLDLAISHYHAVDEFAYSYPEHSFYGDFHGNVTKQGNQPLC